MGPVSLVTTDAAELEQRHELPQRGLPGQVEHAPAGAPGNSSQSSQSPGPPKASQRQLPTLPETARATAAKLSAGQRLAGPYSAPGIQPQQNQGLAGSGALRLLRASPITRLPRPARIFGGGDFQPGRQGFGVRAQCGGQVEVLVDLMGRAEALAADRGGHWDAWRTAPMRRLTSPAERLGIRARPGRGSDRCVSNQFRHGRRSRCAAGFPPARLPAPSGANWAGPAPLRTLPRASGAPPPKALAGAEVSTASRLGWCCQRAASFWCVSRVMCDSGRASRSRCSAGVVMTASPSQLTPRTSRMRRRPGVGGLALRGHEFGIGRAATGVVARRFGLARVSTGYAPRTNWPGRGARPPRTPVHVAHDRRGGPGWPFSCVGISSPASMRQRASPTR